MKWYASRDLLDAMDYMMQTVRKKTTPFGGVQVLFIGDLLQLPQLFGMKSGEPCAYYKNSFFIRMWCSKIHIYIELSKFSVRQIPPLFLF
jgi:hypothetical protein